MNIAVHLACPFQKAPKVGAFVPDKFPKFQEADVFHLDAAVGFNPPQQIGTAPRREPVAARGIPPETNHRWHRIPLSIIPTNGRKPQRTQGLRLIASHYDVPSSDSGMLQSDCRHGLRMTENPRQTAENHYYAALDLLADGDREGARSEYEKSVAADPTFTEAMHGHAKVLVDLERLDEAIMVAKRIAELDPDDVLAHTSLSVIYQKKGMIEEAEAEGAKARVLGWKQQLKKGGG